MSGLRRFIAGAICPACAAVDRLFVDVRDSQQVCECVSCGFQDVRERGALPGSAEFRRGLGDGEIAVPVRIVDPGKS